MDKPFKTYRQQLGILRKRNMIINDGSKAIKILKRENYYNIINGYKDIFIDKNATTDEKFKTGTKFEHVYALYEFDRNLRGIFLKYILKLESVMKSKISYFFSEKYKASFNYFNTSNFDNNNLAEVTKLITRISSTIEQNTKNKNGQICHYLNNYQNLPLWVLMKKLDFGGTSYFYSVLETLLKDRICREILEDYKREYSLNTILTNDSAQLGKILFFVNKFRNACAHDERLYNLNVRNNKKIKFQHFYNPSIVNKYNLFDLLVVLKIFLLKKDFKRLSKSLEREFDNLSQEIPSNIFNLVQIEMGFSKTWATTI